MVWYFDGTTPPLYAKIIIFIVTMILVWLIGVIIKKNLDRVSRKRNFEARNGLKLMISIIQFLALTVIAAFIFEIESTTVLSISALIGTTIGFATSTVVSNVVAGLYLISVRPFGIGDLIIVKGTEGIVMEIGLNYTRLMMLDESLVLIPNKSLLDANLINCSIQMDDLKERASMGHEISYTNLLEDLEKPETKSLGLGRDSSDEIWSGTEIVKYPLTLQAKLSLEDPKIKFTELKKRMEKLMKKWEKKTGFRFRYFFPDYASRQDVRMVLVFHDSHHLLEIYGEFVEDFYRSMYVKLHQKEEN